MVFIFAGDASRPLLSKVVFGQDRTIALAGVVYVAGYFISGVLVGPRMSDKIELRRRRAGVILSLAYLAYWAVAWRMHASHVRARPSRPPLLDLVGWIGVAAMVAGASAWLGKWRPFGRVLELLALRSPDEKERAFGDRVAVWFGIVATLIYTGWWLGKP